MHKVANSVLLKELTKVLDDMDYFTLYPSRGELRRYLQVAVSDGDKIRSILRDEYVQRELFPNWQTIRSADIDPVAEYMRIRRA